MKRDLYQWRQAEPFRMSFIEQVRDAIGCAAQMAGALIVGVVFWTFLVSLLIGGAK